MPRLAVVAAGQVGDAQAATGGVIVASEGVSRHAVSSATVAAQAGSR